MAISKKTPRVIFSGITKKTKNYKPAKKTHKSKIQQNSSKQFPSFPRFISESTLRVKNDLLLYLCLVVFLSCVIMALHLAVQITTKQTLEGNVVSLKKDYSYWQEVSIDYPNYRDAYYQLAIIAYKLHNKDLAREYVGEVLRLDPNFTEGNSLEKLLN